MSQQSDLKILSNNANKYGQCGQCNIVNKGDEYMKRVVSASQVVEAKRVAN